MRRNTYIWILLWGLLAVHCNRNALICNLVHSKDEPDPVSYQINLSDDQQLNSPSSSERRYEIPLGTYVEIKAVSKKPIQVHWDATEAKDVAASSTDDTWHARYAELRQQEVVVQGKTASSASPVYHILWIDPLVEAFKNKQLILSIDGVASTKMTFEHEIERAGVKVHQASLKCTLTIQNKSSRAVDLAGLRLQCKTSWVVAEKDSPAMTPFASQIVEPNSTAKIEIEVKGIEVPMNNDTTNIHWCASLCGQALLAMPGYINIHREEWHQVPMYLSGTLRLDKNSIHPKDVQPGYAPFFWPHSQLPPGKPNRFYYRQ